ncbi:MAG: hypothetical protein NC342_01695 [Pseudoflavonifractor sp.]|nr:hypothetical protein [Alloprevotella sp.]MCM1116236.1 hypothetical protein [Pseudoflavonifractor sp.]
MATITLHIPKARENDSAFKSINTFNKNDVSDSLRPLISLLSSHTIEFTADSDPTLSKLIKALDSPTKLVVLLKAELVSIYAAFSSTIDNLIALAQADTSIKSILVKLAHNPKVPFLELCKIPPTPLTLTKGSSWSYKVLADARIGACSHSDSYGYYFSYEETNWKKDIKIWVSPKQRRKILEDVLKVNCLHPMTTEELPAITELKVVNMSADIRQAIKYLAQTYMSGKLLTMNGQVTKAKIASIARKSAIASFSDVAGKPINAPERLGLLAVAYGYYAGTFDKKGKLFIPTDLLEMAKYTASGLANKLSGIDFGIMIPQYTGFTKAWASNSNASTLIPVINSMLKKANNKWMATGNISTLMLCHEFKGPRGVALTEPLYLFNNDDARRAHLRLNDDEEKSSKTRYTSPTPHIDWWNDITRRFLTSWLWLLCATGMAELAVDTSIPESDILQGIKYARLTPLGRFAMGLTEIYEGDLDDDASQKIIDLDDDNAVVTLLDPTSAFIPYFEQIGRRIGGNRFKITPGSIVAGSSDSNEVRLNCNRFKAIAGNEMTDAWQDIIDQAIERSDCQIADERTFALFKLDPEIPGLIDFVANNQEIAANSVKCQESFILVDGDFVNSFKVILHQAGFIL